MYPIVDDQRIDALEALPRISGRLPTVSTVSVKKGLCREFVCSVAPRVIEHAPTVAGRRLKNDRAIDRARILRSAGFILPTISSRSMRLMVLGFLEPEVLSSRPSYLVDHQAQGASDEVNRPFAWLLARVGKPSKPTTRRRNGSLRADRRNPRRALQPHQRLLPRPARGRELRDIRGRRRGRRPR